MNGRGARHSVLAIQTSVVGDNAKGAAVLERIVVGYAGDGAGADAVRLAGTIAAAVGGRLTVAYPYHPLLAGRPAEQAQEEIAGEVSRLLERLPPEIGRAGVERSGLERPEDGQPGLEQPTLHWTSSPWPIHALHELASYEGADLLVFGAAKHGLADRLHVSLMERMVHGAPCAVAVAPDGYEPNALRRIGVGFAISKEGHEAVELARQLAGLTGGHVKVIAGAGLEPALASYSFSSPALVDVEEEIYTETVQTLDRFCEQLGEGAPVQREVVRGEPAGVLIDASAQLDLLVLGSRAYGPLRHVLLGSVSARVMREARCPVLVIPRGVARGDEHRHEQRAHAETGS